MWPTSLISCEKHVSHIVGDLSSLVSRVQVLLPESGRGLGYVRERAVLAYLELCELESCVVGGKLVVVCVEWFLLFVGVDHGDGG